MADPTNPPRPGLRQSVRNYIAGCTWDAQQSRVEDANGNSVVAWLNETGAPGITSSVQWEAGTATELGNAVSATIPQASYDIVRNGTFNVNTGLVTYNGKTYRFCFMVVSGQQQMSAYAV